MLDYATGLVGDLQRVAGADVCGAYLHGSAALGGWNERISDVDVLVVVQAAVRGLPAVEQVILAGLARCPGTGLELSIVSRDDAHDPMEPWPFVLHVAGRDEAARVISGAQIEGDGDLVLHYAVCRGGGRSRDRRPARRAADRTDSTTHHRVGVGGRVGVGIGQRVIELRVAECVPRARGPA